LTKDEKKPSKLEDLKARFEDMLELEARIIRLESQVDQNKCDLRSMRARLSRMSEEEEEETIRIPEQPPQLLPGMSLNATRFKQ